MATFTAPLTGEREQTLGRREAGGGRGGEVREREREKMPPI